MGNAEMVKKTGAKIIIHEEDAPLLVRQPPDLLMMFKAKPSPPADILVKDGDVIRIGKLGVKVLHTPDILLEGCRSTWMARFLQAIPSLWDPWVEPISPDAPGRPWRHRSGQKLYTLPGDTTVYPGHNYGLTPYSTIQYERRHKPLRPRVGGHIRFSKINRTHPKGRGTCLSIRIFFSCWGKMDGIG